MSDSEEKATKKLFFTVKIDRMWKEIRTLTRADKQQYRTDIKAVMCRGIPEKDMNTIK
jgi:hypothetical protein